MTETDDFVAIIARARVGDADAVTALVRRYESEVRLVARYWLSPALRPYLDSGDLVQSVHGSLIRGLRADCFRLDRPEQLIGLAMTIARRKAAKMWRKLRRQERNGVDGRSLPQVLMELHSQQADPADDVAYRDAVERLCRDLQPMDRTLLERTLQGFRTAEIARDMGVDADLLRVRLSRLRSRLRQAGIAEDW